MIYLDNAATSWPKPKTVAQAMVRFLEEIGANPGRSGHRPSMEAGRVVYEAREAVAGLVGFHEPLAVAFTKNASEALNLAILGLLAPGDHVVTSVMQHNSVLRPLRWLESQGVSVSRLACGGDGSLDPDDVSRALTAHTKLVVLGHASNVTGEIVPVGEIGAMLAQRDVLFCVDAAQTAGVLPLDMRAMHIDLLAFTGHKALFGPPGTGGLCIGERARGRLRPLIYGGTGSRSDSDRHPDFLPDVFEAGTLNTVGLAGLAAGIAFIEAQGPEEIRRREMERTGQLLAGLREISGLRIFGPGDARRQTAVVSVNLDGWSCSELALALEERAGVCCRAGLHCAPLSHRQIGTFPQGTLRLSPGCFTTESEIRIVLDALCELAREGKGSRP